MKTLLREKLESLTFEEIDALEKGLRPFMKETGIIKILWAYAQCQRASLLFEKQGNKSLSEGEKKKADFWLSLIEKPN